MRIYTYVASAGGNRFYVCHAYNKEQMKYANMNVKLHWIRFKSRDEAFEYIRGFPIKAETNVSNVRYW